MITLLFDQHVTIISNISQLLLFMSFLRDPSNVKILISLTRLTPMEKGINNHFTSITSLNPIYRHFFIGNDGVLRFAG